MTTTNLARRDLVAIAFRLEWTTIVWMFAEFGVALYGGIAAHSLALIAFSLDSVIEIVHAAVLVWRLRLELKLGLQFHEATERRAARIGGGILAVLAVYIFTGAIWELWLRRGADFSLSGLILTAIAIPVMYGIARRKYRLSELLESRALRGDAAESASCLYLSITIVVALIAQSVLGAWWIDGAASLLIAFFVAREALESFEDRHCSEGC